MTRKEQTKIKLPTPSTAQFAHFIHTVAKPALFKAYGREYANQLINLIHYLEHKRYDFSKDRAYQTRPLCINELAEYWGVSHRSVQRWLAALESHGILEREYRKDPQSRFRNKFSRIAFPAFKKWFCTVLKAAHDALRHPPEKAILDSNLSTENCREKKEAPEAFPDSGGVKYSPYWLKLAMENLPGGSKRPCSTLVAERFRANLKQYEVSLSHPSLTARWISFCKRAKPAF